MSLITLKSSSNRLWWSCSCSNFSTKAFSWKIIITHLTGFLLDNSLNEHLKQMVWWKLLTVGLKVIDHVSAEGQRTIKEHIHIWHHRPTLTRDRGDHLLDHLLSHDQSSIRAEWTGWHSSPFHPPMRTIRCSKVGLELWVLTQITFRYVYNAQHTIHRMLENKDGEMGEIILTFSWTFRWKSVRWKQKNGVMKNKRC